MKQHYKLFLFLLLSLLTSSLFAQDYKEQIDDLMQKYYDYNLFNGTILVADDGEVIIKEGYGFANMEWEVPNTPDTKFRIGSISKQFTATIIMQLVEEGIIDLNGKITDYLPDYRKDTGDIITIHQLLNHTSGILPYTSLPNVWSDSLRIRYDEDYFIRNFHSEDLEFEPGSQFAYNNTGYYLLAVIAEEVTGKEIGELLKERILDPVGMMDSGSEDTDEVIKKKAYGYIEGIDGYSVDPPFFMLNAKGAGHMYSTVEDMLKWDQALYLDDVLSETSKEKMFTPYLANYGYGWGIFNLPLGDEGDSIKAISHSGGIYGFSTFFVRFPEEKKTIVIFNNTGGAPMREMMQNILNILYDKEINEPKIPIIDVFVDAVNENGIDVAIENYKELKENNYDEYNFSENQLNRAGYYFMNKEDYETAEKIFKLNIEAYPDAFNTYDSYAEALMEKGDNEGAIENYKKSLELNPGNSNAVETLKELGVEYSAGVSVSPEILKMYEGEYELFPNFTIKIRPEEEKLFAQATGQSEFEIFPSSKTKFYYKVVDAQIEFIKDDDGEVNELILYQNNQEIKGTRLN